MAKENDKLRTLEKINCNCAGEEVYHDFIKCIKFQATEEAKNWIKHYSIKMFQTAADDVCRFCKQEDPKDCNCFYEIDSKLDFIKEFFNISEEEFMKIQEELIE